ncbi:MAG: hypothetical protein ACKOPE_12810, partial [Novosphingobium sp.]
MDSPRFHAASSPAAGGHRRRPHACDAGQHTQSYGDVMPQCGTVRSAQAGLDAAAPRLQAVEQHLPVTIAR